MSHKCIYAIILSKLKKFEYGNYYLFILAHKQDLQYVVFKLLSSNLLTHKVHSCNTQKDGYSRKRSIAKSNVV